MKFRTVKYFLKEGLSNIWKNKWMSIASAGVVMLLLCVFGALFLTAVNINSMFGRMEDQPLNAFIAENTEAKQIDSAKKKVEKISGVKKVVLITAEQRFKDYQDKLKDGKSVLEGIKPREIFTDMLVVSIKNSNDAIKVKTDVEKIKEIKKVNYPKEVMDKISKFVKIGRLVLYVIISFLAVVAIFIIMYTIKLTVFARRREITIMKYVGATDWFIKWPFVIEGFIIGLIGACIALLLTFIGYNFIYGTMAPVNIELIRMVLLDVELKKQLFLMFIVLGCGIGSVGSIISVRKYLDV